MPCRMKLLIHSNCRVISPNVQLALRAQNLHRFSLQIYSCQMVYFMCVNYQNIIKHIVRWKDCLWVKSIAADASAQKAKFMGPTWGPPGSCRPQTGPMLAMNLAIREVIRPSATIMFSRADYCPAHNDIIDHVYQIIVIIQAMIWSDGHSGIHLLHCSQRFSNNTAKFLDVNILLTHGAHFTNINPNMD